MVFTRDNRHAQDFTADRMLLRRAVRRFRPMRSTGASPFGVLQRAQRFLADMPGYRRALVLISPVATDGDAGAGQEFGVKDSIESASRELAAVSSSARISHVPIYLFSTHGLHAPTAQDLRWSGGVNAAYEIHVETLRTIAGLTGGRAIAANNAPTELVPAVLDELALYYALAYESSYPADGRRRWLQIDVARRDVMVMPSRVLITAARPRTEPAHHRLLDSARDSGLVEAIGAPLPAGDVPLRLASAPFAVPSRREQAVALTLALPSPALGVEDYRIRLMLFDAEGRRELLTETHDVHVSGSSAKEGQEWLEVALRLDVRPGRYNLRVAAEPRSSRTSGSVRATLIVPDFANDPISLSGVAIGRAGSDTIAGREKLSGLLPFAPTAVRVFAANDRVGALLRIHQPTRRPAQPVTLLTEIVDGTGTLVQASSRAISADAFVDGAGVEHRVELPRGSLPTGGYLLRFVASAGPSRAQRDVRFEIVPNPASRVPHPDPRSPIPDHDNSPRSTKIAGWLSSNRSGPCARRPEMPPPSRPSPTTSSALTKHATWPPVIR